MNLVALLAWLVPLAAGYEPDGTYCVSQSRPLYTGYKSEFYFSSNVTVTSDSIESGCTCTLTSTSVIRYGASNMSIDPAISCTPVSYTHLRAHETVLDLVCRLLLEKKNYIPV
eukprot:TRINITY_DN33553_c0_g1_i1.p1 TRINITY_DN33553_c0_g1~~TRINITY_DN33553_c0_g1_i1.p1  ORF type:complete len:113 (+),score=7.65 TRINITY_DN33553_c0_g1_i1:187-525(+)